MANIAIFASGNGSNFQVLTEAFQNDTENQVKVLICNRKNAFVFERAKKLGVQSEYVNYLAAGEKAAEDKIFSLLAQYQIDVIFLAGYMKIFSKRFLDGIKIPLINIHPSLLPKHKGTEAIEKAYHSGDKEIGISIHYVTEEVDSGEIILQKSIPLEKVKGLDFVESEVHKLEHQWYPVVAKEICKKMNNRV